MQLDSRKFPNTDDKNSLFLSKITKAGKTVHKSVVKLPIQKYLAKDFRKLLTMKSSVFLERFRHFYHLKFEILNQEISEGGHVDILVIR